MSIFEVPPTDAAMQVREWVEFHPINQLGVGTYNHFPIWVCREQSIDINLVGVINAQIQDRFFAEVDTPRCTLVIRLYGFETKSAEHQNQSKKRRRRKSRIWERCRCFGQFAVV